jgi:hypothetical protein
MSESGDEPRQRQLPAGIDISVGIGVGTVLGFAFDRLALGIARGTAMGAALEAASRLKRRDET